MEQTREPVTCDINYHQDFLDGRDMGETPGFDGFTIGKGRLRYHLLTWTRFGNAAVYRFTPEGLVRRYISGHTEITIHFKPS